MEKIVTFELILIALVGMLLYGSKVLPTLRKLTPKMTTDSTGISAESVKNTSKNT